MNLAATVVDEISGYEERLRVAQAHSDVEALDGLIADDLMFVDLAGQIVTKGMDLEAHRSGRLQISHSELKEQEIRALNQGAAVAIVKLHLVGQAEGVAFDSEVRYTRVWQNRMEGWRIVAGHMSLVAGN